MKAYKGFKSDMTCRGFQYEDGETYEEPIADLCNKGFHACENPLDCLEYYHPADGAVYREVELGGVSPQRGNDTKVCGTKIRIGAKIDLAQVIKGGVDFVFSKVDWKPAKNGDSATSAANGYSAKSAANGDSATSAANGYSAKSAANGDSATSAANGDSATSAANGYSAKSAANGYSATSAAIGDYATSAANGDSATSAAIGDYATSAANGDSATSAANGKCATSAANGDYATSEAKGKECIAAALGRGVKARASKGGWIVLSEIDKNGHILDIKAFKVDDEEIKADTWYSLKNGELVEVE